MKKNIYIFPTLEEFKEGIRRARLKRDRTYDLSDEELDKSIDLMLKDERKGLPN